MVMKGKKKDQKFVEMGLSRDYVQPLTSVEGCLAA